MPQSHFPPASRVTPDNITELQPGEVFVFGSNLKGIHGRGAALTAKQRFGAVEGVGEGYFPMLDGAGRGCYALPTGASPRRPLPGGLDDVRAAVTRFIDFAESHPEQRFLVTEVGCGLAGYAVEQIAPLFQAVVHLDNVSMPRRFWACFCSTCHTIVDMGYCACDEES